MSAKQEARRPRGVMPSTSTLLGVLLALTPVTCFLPTPILHSFVTSRRVSGCSVAMNLPGGTGGMQGAIVTQVGPNLYNVDVEGSICQNGKLGQVIYNKILSDQKREYTARPMPGFRKGTIPPQIMPRIKFAAIEQLCSQTCEAALEEEGITMSEGQTELSTTNSLEFPGFDGLDVPGYCKASAWKPGKDVSFRAYRVRGIPSGGGRGGAQEVEMFPGAKTPEGIDLSTTVNLF